MRMGIHAGVMFVGACLFGCGSDFQCDDTATCPAEADGSGGAAGSSAESTTSTSSSGGAGGHVDKQCDPDVGPPEEGCGLFVSDSLGKSGAAGTRAEPLATIGEAIAKASVDQPIYVCNETFKETLHLTEARTIVGGLDCASGWMRTGEKKTTIAAPPDAIALRIDTDAKGTELYDLVIRAADATLPGGSSIAVWAQGVQVALVRCDVSAGSGADGAAGTTPTGIGALGEGANGQDGGDGQDGCLDDVAKPGGAGGANTCGGVDVSGGLGGQGTSTSGGGAGSNGYPDPVLPATEGVGGKQQDSTACGSGTAGLAGTPGLPGFGAQGLGTFTEAGYQGESGLDGASSGAPGQGGGGGGGAKKCSNNPPGPTGPSGGGGGAGGCGGQPGKGGQGGGSSFGIVSMEAKLTLTNVLVTTAAGGNGGQGGDGQPGGYGGKPGLAGDPGGACTGGQGGDGGRGGSGGGGQGGHSIGLVYLGEAPIVEGLTILAGSAGVGGVGGDGDVAASGADGMACTTLNFADAASCSP